MPIIQPEVDYIDKKTKTIHLKDGRAEPLSDDAAYSLFESKGARELRTGAKQAEKDLAKATSPEAYTFLRNFGQTMIPKAINDYVVNPAFAAGRAVSTREGQEDMGFLSRMYENLEARNRGAREGLHELEQENPYSALAGGLTSFGADLATPLPKGLKGRPVLAGAAIGSIAGEKPIYEDPMGAAKNAGIGAGIGYGVGKLQKVAGERSALRQHPEQVSRIGEANEKAQTAFTQTMEKKLTGLDSNLPKVGVGKNALNVPGFINAEINVSPIAGSSEANGLIKFFETVEKGLPEVVKEGDIKKIYRVIESRLKTASDVERPFLTRFREHIVENLPLRVGQAVAKEKVTPKIFKQYQKEMSRTIDAMVNDIPMIDKLAQEGVNKQAFQGFKGKLFKSVEDVVNKMSPEDFAQAYEKGHLNQLLAQVVYNSPVYKGLVNELGNSLTKFQKGLQKNYPGIALSQAQSDTQKAYNKAIDYVKNIKDSAISAANKSVPATGDFMLNVNDAAERLASKMSNAVGVKNPYISRSIPPSNARPTPTPLPPPPQVGKMAQSFENPNFYKDIGKKATSMKGGLGGFLATQAVGLGNTAAGAGGVAALTSMLRGATRPDALGQFNRNLALRGGVEGVIAAISEKPSYKNGILLDPQERRDAVAEIENDPQLPLGDKAVLQARINRGISLEQMLEKYR
jgi:hypothetical protein